MQTAPVVGLLPAVARRAKAMHMQDRHRVREGRRSRLARSLGTTMTTTMPTRMPSTRRMLGSWRRQGGDGMAGDDVVGDGYGDGDHSLRNLAAHRRAAEDTAV